MKLSTKIILPIILISALLILLTGCFGVPDDSPGYTPGTTTISGIIAAPCCSTSSAVVSGAPSDWCLQCEQNWFLQKNIEVILTYEGEKIGSTTTNTQGEYTFANLSAGENYVITAICPDNEGYPLVKDVVKEVVDGEDYDAGITDCESTALGIIVDALVNLGISSEYIILEDIQGAVKFESFVEALCEVLESCGDVTVDDNLLDQGNLVLMEILGENPGWTGGEVICVFNVPETYVLTTLANPPEGGTVSGAGTYDPGTVVPVTASPATGWEFVNWTGDLTGTTNPDNVTMNSNKSVTANFMLIPTYTVTYDLNGGTSGSQTDTLSPYYAGVTVTVLDQGSMVKTNYHFTGWNTAANGSGTAYAPAATFPMPAANVVLYAQWSEDTKYTVTYDLNGGTSGSQTDTLSPYYAGVTVTVLDQGSMVKTNYHFTGWNTAANGSGTAYAPAATFPMPAANVVLYAQWSEDTTYTVTYDLNGGTSGSQTDTLSPYYAGVTVTVLDQGSMVKTNYHFTGWNTAANGSGTAYAPAATFPMPAANVVLYAQWSEDTKYTVTYDLNGGTSGSQTDTLSPYYAGVTVTVLDQGSMVKTNYHFTGWNTAANGSGTAYAPAATFPMPAANVVLYAQWSEDTKYTVTYDLNGGTSGSQTDTLSPYYAGVTVTVLDQGSMVKTNYHFTGWNTAANGSGTAYAPAATFPMPAANVVLYAQWSEDTKYTVTYDLNGGTSGSQTDTLSPYYAGVTVTVLDQGSMVKTNYHFTGWNTAANGSGTAYAPAATFPMPAANVVLYAQWSEDTKYTVTYDLNGGTSGSQTDTLSPYYAGVTVTVLDQGSMVKTNYHFTGWNTAANGSGTAYAPAATFPMPAANVVLYAQWSEDTKYTVTYDLNGGTSGSQTDTLSPYYAGVTVTVLDQGSMVKTNYHFTGWNTAANGSGTAYAPAATFPMPAANVVLYAQWSEDTKYTVTYDLNGGTSGSQTDTLSPYYAGVTVTVLDQGSMVKTNYHFTGWNTAANGSGTAYAPAATFPMPAANVVLYAQWSEDTKYTVTYDGNGNTSGTAPVDTLSPYYAGVTVTVLGQGDLARDKYNFTGWNTAADGTGTAYVETDTFTMPAANVVLYAQWENLDPLMSPIDVVPGQNQIRINLRDVNDNPVLGLDDKDDWVVILSVPNSDPTILSVEYGGPAVGPWDFQIRVVSIPQGTLLRNVTVTYNGYGYPIILHEAY